MILGDAYLQKTGSKNARIRLEHGFIQREYLAWKVGQFSEFFSTKLSTLQRYNPVFGKTYTYVRAQSYASEEFGKFRTLFYSLSGVKTLPENFVEFFTKPSSLAVWFMDDGYYYKRDRIAYIYLPNYDEVSFRKLLEALSSNFSLFPRLKKKSKGWCLVFTVKETDELVRIIKPYIIKCMEYKLGKDS